MPSSNLNEEKDASPFINITNDSYGKKAGHQFSFPRNVWEPYSDIYLH